MNLLVTVVLLPAVFPARASRSGPDSVRAGTFDTVAVSAVALADPRLEQAIDTLAPLPTTTTVAPPPTTLAPRPRPTTTVPRRPDVRPAQATPTTARPTTSTTARPTTTTSTTRPPAPPTDPNGGTQEGKGTWYHQQSGICAHRTLPFGTVVTVVNTRNGRSTQCTVGDRGPFVAGYIIDLAPEQFDQISARSAGVFPAKISW